MTGTGSSSSGTVGGASQCRQKADADTTTDCANHNGNTRKLDCTTSEEQADAIAKGCVKEKETSTSSKDVCCPTTVTGAAP